MKQISDEDYKKLMNLIYQIRNPELQYNSPRDIIRGQICKGEKAYKIMCIAWSNVRDFNIIQSEPVTQAIHPIPSGGRHVNIDAVDVNAFKDYLKRNREKIVKLFTIPKSMLGKI